MVSYSVALMVDLLGRKKVVLWVAEKGW